ncbi:hypothetical protein DFH06DRAFT_1095634 [Mycena polygramma]|nr:hypothetical protein DFH06DRAFT_1095634 [Mycena polygramma]
MTQLCPNCGVPPSTLTLLSDSLPAVSSPDLTHVLTSNDPPLESELPSIHTYIGDGQDTIRELDAQIGSLEAQIHNLRAALFRSQSRRHEVAENVRQHQSIMSPIRRVPAELICEIFLAASSSEDAVAVNKPPWYLGHICQAWRHHALSYPALWLSITVTSQFTTQRLAMLEAQLLRSANAPLDIYWRGDYHTFDQRLQELIVPHSRRWRRLNFDGCSHGAWLQAVSGRLDQLQKVELDPLSDWTGFQDVFSTARHLRQIILTNRGFSISRAIEIPWEQITHYHGSYSPERQLEILRAAAPTLLECVIGFRSEDFGSESPQILTLPKLCRLSSEYVAILAHLTAPSLSELRLIIAHEPIRFAAPFIHRSSCTLTRLALIEYEMNADVISLLRAVPNLSSLLLDLDNAHEIDSDSITAMFISGAPSDICPRLTTFELGYISPSQIIPTREPFFAMARTRFQRDSSSHCRLSRLRLLAGRTSPSDSVAVHIRNLQEDGFDVVLLDRGRGLRASLF